MYYMDSMVPSCTNNKSCICTTWIQWCRPLQTTRAVYVLHGFNGAVLYKQQELYMYYMDSMVPSCTNNKSCICTTWIQWCRPVQTTRAVYVLHGFNGAVLYKQQELYMYYMDSMAPSCTIKVITKLPNSEQSYKGKVKTHNYINRQNQSTTGKL